MSSPIALQLLTVVLGSVCVVMFIHWSVCLYALLREVETTSQTKVFHYATLVFFSQVNATLLGSPLGHFRVVPSLCFKARLSAKPLIWKRFFILMQIKLIFTRKVLHQASFWKWKNLELGNGLITKSSKGGWQRFFPLLFWFINITSHLQLSV